MATQHACTSPQSGSPGTPPSPPPSRTIGRPQPRWRDGVRARRGRGLRLRGAGIALAIGVLVGLPVAGAGGAPALAAAGDQAQDEYDAAAAEVGRIEQLVSAAEEDLARATVEAEAAGEVSRAAEAELVAAQAAAIAALAELEAAEAEAGRAQEDVATLGREAFMGADPFGNAAALLDAGSPGELLQRAATLDLLGEDRARRLEALEAVRAQRQDADRVARAAVADRDAAFQTATQAETAARDQLAGAQRAYDAATTQRADLESQLRDAEIRLLAAQGASDPGRAWEVQQGTQQALAAAGTGSLVSGRVTSCYGSRWGTNHNGIDIAGPIGTPIYAPEGGTVLHAGPANGFGLAVYIQHPDGVITVYGHINQAFVSTGQRVSAGQQIAEVGNRGQSTGPHLHVETHTGGLYQNRVDPAPWLAARGITLGGACA